jgi:hypothetical protein
MSTVRLAVLALLVFAAPPVQAQGEGREDLRRALGDYYVHVVSERLELSDEQAGKLRPRLVALAGTQLEARSATRAVERRLAKAMRSQEPRPEELAVLLAELLDAEADAQDRLRRARGGVVDALKPAQQAAFLLSEDEYRRAVRRHLRELRAGQRDPGVPGEADSPWRRDRPQLEGQAGPAPRGRRPGEKQRTELRENLTLLLAFQLRTQGQVPLARIADLLPQLEVGVGTQLDLAQAERTAREELQAALDNGDKGPALEARVNALLEGRAALSRRLADARRAIVNELEPLEAVRFLQLQDGVRKSGPRRLRMMMQAGMGDDGGPARDRGMRRHGGR